MPHQMTYLHISCNGYDRNWLSNKERNAFKVFFVTYIRVLLVIVHMIAPKGLCFGIRFMSELIDQLLQQGRMVTAETDCGPGIRTATAKELKNSYRHPVEQLQVDQYRLGLLLGQDQLEHPVIGRRQDIRPHRQ